MLRSDVYAAIDGERAYQQRRWGPGGTGLRGQPSRFPVVPTEAGPEHAHEVAAFILYMEDYLAEARRLAAREGGDGPALDALRKVVALGVACFEQHGCPPREEKP